MTTTKHPVKHQCRTCGWNDDRDQGGRWCMNMSGLGGLQHPIADCPICTWLTLHNAPVLTSDLPDMAADGCPGWKP